MILSLRSPRIPGLLILVGCMLLAPPRDAHAATEIVATRLSPSCLSARYGSAVLVHAGSPGGTYLVPTRSGVESRGSGASTDTLYGSFRTAGVVQELALAGSTAYLFAGDRGIVAVDVGDSTNLVAIGSHDHLGDIKHGAFAPSSGTLAAATDASLFFFRETAPGALDLIDRRLYTDGRHILRVQARSDSFLVLSLNTSSTLRMLLTLYRARAASAPESLWEYQANGFQAADLAWPDAMAFIAVGNNGVLPFDTETQIAGAAVPVGSGQLILDVDADPTSVVVVGEARTYAEFVRSGPKGSTLGSELDRLTTIEPLQVSLVGGLAIISEDDAGQTAPSEPDEVGRSLLEKFNVGGGPPPTTTTTGLGRARRVVMDQGLAYVADYAGGLRIYRAGSADTSLVGVFPLGGTARAYDVALDPARKLAYLASGTAGLITLSVANPSAPAPVGQVSPPGSTVAVAVADTIAVLARRGGSSAGISVVDVSDSLAPVIRGNMNFPFIQDPRAVAIRDSVAYVADQLLGLFLVSFANPSAPAMVGAPSGFGALDLDLSGTRLIVGTVGVGVQIADVSNPASIVISGSVRSPPVIGVTQLGQTAIACLGDGGVLAIDIRNPFLPLARGMIQLPGYARGAAWVGDTLLVASSFGLERFRANATVGSDPALGFTVDNAAALPRVTIAWNVSAPPGAIGWNVYRETGPAADGLAGGPDLRVNDALLSPATRAALDVAVPAGGTFRYRLEAFFTNGSSVKAAEGSVFIGSNAVLGRVYPNPYRPRNGLALQIPYRVLPVDGGKSIELRVYELSGRLVRRIAGTTAPGGGFGSMTWDGRDGRGRLLADGIYFMKVEGPGIHDARQLILLR